MPVSRPLWQLTYVSRSAILHVVGGQSYVLCMETTGRDELPLWAMSEIGFGGRIAAKQNVPSHFYVDDLTSQLKNLSLH